MSTTFPYQTSIPRSHLLANGEYSVLLTAAGSGFSQWKDCAITRWREDVTCDDRGSFVYLRDLESGVAWSAGFQPLAVTPDEYSLSFEEGAARIKRRDGDITTTLDVIVDEGGVELRRITLRNQGDDDRNIELTTYSELVLAPARNDASHPAFSKIFVQTEFDEGERVLLASRRPRTPSEQRICVAQWLQIVDSETDSSADVEFETDRARFIGRGGTLRSPAALADNAPLSGTVGTVLDPIFSLRQRIRVAAGENVSVLLVTVAAETREGVMAIVAKRRYRTDFDSLLETAKRRGNAALGGFGVDAEQASRFQRMANALIYSDSSLRASADQIGAGKGGSPTLWSGGISGDNPIVLVTVVDEDGLALIDEVLTAQCFWLVKGLTADVVMLGNGGEALQKAMKKRVEDEKARQNSDDKPHRFAVAVDDIANDLRDGLHSVARIVLDQSKGSLADQVSDLPTDAKYSTASILNRQQPVGELASVESTSVTTAQVESRPLENALERYNGYGGYDRDGREFVTIVRDGVRPPMPWLNVIANPEFGFTATEAGSGYCWAINSQKNTLTPWANDPVIDPPNSILYIRDRDDGVILTATALPGDTSTGDFVARHGQGYSRFQRNVHGIEMDLLEYIPIADSVRISRLIVRNRSGRSRRFSVTAFVHWSLGGNGSQPQPFVSTELDSKTGALFASNRWREDFAYRVAFIDLRGEQASHSGDRREFLGRHGSVVSPLALSDDAPLSGNVGAGIDPCGALQTTIELADDEEREIVLLLGDADGAKGARELVERYRNADLDTIYSEASGQWNDMLGTVQVQTPDRGMDLLLNGWLLYQALACRVWARTAYYQSSGAYGFRDQLQDVMAVCVSRPDVAREHLVRAAGRQFVEGDVQHWWLPPSGGGIRTRMTDDRLWLPYVLCHYLDVTNDQAVLDERQTFLIGDVLKEGQDESFFTPANADEDGSIYEHCARAIDVSLELGERGLPLIGTGDWNDGMNRVGEKGKGESVWLA
ncbi:MAG: glycosyl transferase family 36, partial [Dokdonella sp.]